MTILSSILIWKIPWTEEPGRLESDTTEKVTPTNQPNMQKTFRGLWLVLQVKPNGCESLHIPAGEGKLLLPWYCALLMLPLKV